MLLVGHEDLGLHRPRRAIGANVLHDADDRHRRKIVEPAADGAAKRIDAGERILCQLLVDERHHRRTDAIGIGDVAAAHDRHLQRPEIVRRDHVEERLRRLHAEHLGPRPALNPVAAVRP